MVRLAAFLTLLAWACSIVAAPPAVIVLLVNEVIGPATSDYVHRGIEYATEQQAQLIVIKMDTPGGLDTSMRAIIKDMLASPIPVAVFVAPGGARAASAGTYILYASHIAAMAPATNLGAATPVQIGGMPDTREPEAGKREDKENRGKPADAREAEKSTEADTMTRKQVNDAAAYIRGLAHMRGRNADWAEKAVREAVSLSADEALKSGVIDFVASDVPELMNQVNGRRLDVLGQERVLNTAGIHVAAFEPDWRVRFLATITNPSIAYILMLVGVYGLFFEFSNPGYVLPGVAGTICLLLALYAFHLLPTNYVGLALIALGVAFMVAEAFLPSFGSLGVGGVIAFVIGSVMLIDTGVPGYGIPLSLVIGIAVVSVVFLIFVAGSAVKARRRPVVSGREELMGSPGEALEDFEQEGWARVHGENWRVRSAIPLQRGRRIRVTGINGLVLDVVPESPPREGE